MYWKFSPQYSFPGCAFYYYLTHAVLALAGFTLFAITAKKYKLHRRDDITPIHQFAEDFVERDIKKRAGFYLQLESELYATAN